MPKGISKETDFLEQKGNKPMKSRLKNSPERKIREQMNLEIIINGSVAFLFEQQRKSGFLWATKLQ